MLRMALFMSIAVISVGGVPGQPRPEPEPSSGSALGEAPAEGEARLALTTNAAYLLLSAVSLRPASVFLILPLELQVALGPRLALAPAALLIYNGGAQATLVAECGLSWHPWGGRLSGWYAMASPGAAYALDSNEWCFVASASAGYQWISRLGALIGLGLGWRHMAMPGGSMSIPDLKMTLGWAWR